MTAKEAEAGFPSLVVGLTWHCQVYIVLNTASGSSGLRGRCNAHRNRIKPNMPGHTDALWQSVEALADDYAGLAVSVSRCLAFGEEKEDMRSWSRMSRVASEN